MMERPIKGKAFKVPQQFLKDLSSIKDEGLASEIRVLCERVEQLVAELGISDECIGFITDGDLALPWMDSISEENQEKQWVSCSQLLYLSETVLDAACRVPENSFHWSLKLRQVWERRTSAPL